MRVDEISVNENSSDEELVVNINIGVTKCPAAGNVLKKTKCLAVENFHATPATYVPKGSFKLLKSIRCLLRNVKRLQKLI